MARLSTSCVEAGDGAMRLSGACGAILQGRRELFFMSACGGDGQSRRSCMVSVTSAVRRDLFFVFVFQAARPGCRAGDRGCRAVQKVVKLSLCISAKQIGELGQMHTLFSCPSVLRRRALSDSPHSSSTSVEPIARYPIYFGFWLR